MDFVYKTVEGTYLVRRGTFTGWTRCLEMATVFPANALSRDAKLAEFVDAAEARPVAVQVTRTIKEL